MSINSKAKHIKNISILKNTSLGLIGLLVAVGLVATVTPSQAVPVVEDIYCQQNISLGSDVDDSTPALDILWPAANGEPSYGVVRLDLADIEAQLADDSQATSQPTSIQFANGNTAAIRVGQLTGPGVFQLDFYLEENQGVSWPITLKYEFEDAGYTDVVNTNASFTSFKPCTGNLGDAETANTDDAFDNFGKIKMLSEGSYIDVSAVSSSNASNTIVRKSVLEGVTTFTYMTERFSDEEGAAVDVAVTVEFSGNTVRWNLEAFEYGTPTPADITFYIEGELGSDETTEFATSNGVSYSTDRFTYGDPALIYASDAGAPATVTNDNVRFNFADVTSGFLEITLIGFERCATDEERMAAIDNFTDNYLTLKYTDQPDAIGAACVRECQPNTETIERTPGNFDVGGIPLCFDTAFESTDSSDPKTLLEQEVQEGPNIGKDMAQGDSVEYQNVAQGGDANLHAVVTVSTLYQQQENQISGVDYFEYRDNAWIQTGISTLEGEEDRYVEYTVVFFESGDVSRTPVSVDNLNLSVYDIDNNQFFSASGVNTYSLASETILTASAAGSQLRVSENAGEGSDFGDESRVSMIFKKANSFVFRMGISAGDSDSGGASFGLDFTGGNAWGEAPVERDFNSGRGGSGNATIVPAPTKSLVAKKVIDAFAPESPRLLKAQKSKIRTFLNKYPQVSSVTCTGYTAGPVKQTDKVLAKKRATNVCAYVKKIDPEIETKVAGRTPGLPLSPLSRKVTIAGYSVSK